MIGILDVLARAGGGGSNSGGGGAFGILVIPFIIAGYYISKRKRQKRIAGAKARQQLAVSVDPHWDDAAIKQRVREVFMAFQADWSTFNTANMGSYLTHNYHKHMALVMIALWNMKRKNTMENLHIKSIELIHVDDRIDNDQDRFAVEITATATDRLIDMKTNSTIHYGPGNFSEIWHFKRTGNIWNLDNISQITHDGGLVSIIQYEPQVDARYTSFAQQNGFYYNADFGWLLLPFAGTIFSNSSFGGSNVDHHIIGMHHNIVVQFFEYTPLVNKDLPVQEHFKHVFKRRRNPLSTYVVCHATLPREYGNILVEPRAVISFATNAPQKLRRVRLEWPTFNRRYDVFATQQEQATSLELLHPAFMEKLVALPFKVGIQVVGADLYFYPTDKKADYSTMLALLKDAFKEMKM